MTGRLVSWALAFTFTQIAEIPIYRRLLGVGFGRAFGASAITHPIVWLVAVESGWSAPWLLKTILCEAFAVGVEAAYFGLDLGWKRGALASLLANAVSFGLGLAAYALFGRL